MATDLADIGRSILDIWSDALDRQVDSVDSDFFRIGGDSFLAALVAGALSEEFDVNVSVTDLYSHRTASQLAKHVVGLIDA